MVVSATRTERALEDVPVSVTVVPHEALERAPSRTLDDALRTVVGLNLPLGNSNLIQPTTNRVSMRGLGGDRALVLLDGVPLNDGVGGYVHWNKAPLQSIERVEAARGAASSLFGNYAMGGVVSITTRPMEPGQLDGGASYGSFDTTRFNAAVADGLGKGWSVGVWADYEKTDGYNRTPPADRGAVDVASNSKTMNLMTKVGWTAPSGLGFNVRGSVTDQDTGQGTPLSNNYQKLYTLAGGGLIPLGGSSLSLSGFYQETDYTLDNTSLVPGAGRDREYISGVSGQPGWDSGGSLQWTMPLAGVVQYVTAGLDFRRVASHDWNQAFNVAGQPTGYRQSQGRQYFAGFFAEASFVPTRRFEALLSARIDGWQNVGGKEQNTAGGVTEYADQSTTRFDPRLSLRYALSDVFALRGAAYRAFKAPTLRDLYRSSSQRTLTIVPNPFLGPETLVGGDVGVDVTAGIFRGQVNFFYNTIDGIIARKALATTPILVVQPQNIGTARAQGIEVMGSFALSRSVSFDVGYAFNDSTVTDNPADPTLVGKQLPDVPRHSGNLTLTWAPRWGLSVAFRGRGQSVRYGDDANLLAMDQHFIFDLFVSYPVLKNLDLFVSAENLFDYQYISEVNVGRRLGQPQAFFVGLRLRQPLASLGGGASRTP
jgi:outer membrane receptor protein involved in Fe transport